MASPEAHPSAHGSAPATWPHGPEPLVVRNSRPVQAAMLFVLVSQLPSWAAAGWFLVGDHRWIGLALGTGVGASFTWLFRPLAGHAFATTTFTADGIEWHVPGRAPVAMAYDRLLSIGYRQHRGARSAVLYDSRDERRTIDLSLDLRGAYHPPAARWWPAVARELLRHADTRGVPVQARARRALERLARR